jgi:hypothetical protein
MFKRPLSSQEFFRFRLFGAAAAKLTPTGYYQVSSKLGAMLVSPLNGDPYVVDFNNQEAVIFESVKGSGTDSLRQRIRAQLYFDDLPEQGDLLRAG